MSRSARLIVFLAVGLAAAAAGYLIHIWSAPGAARPDPGEVLLSAQLPDTSGDPQSLAQWRGKVLVVNFWATWCPPCVKEVPELVRMQQRYGPKGVQFVGIAVDDLERVRAFMIDAGLNYPVLMAEREGLDLARHAGNRLGALPYTVIIGREGRAAHTELGALDEGKLVPLLDPLL